MARHLLPDTRSQIPTLFAFVTESNANREYEAGHILGQAAKYRGVIQPIKMSFDSWINDYSISKRIRILASPTNNVINYESSRFT